MSLVEHSFSPRKPLMPSPLPPTLVTLEEAARLLGVPYWSIVYLCRRDSIPYVRVGRSKLIDLRDLQGHSLRLKSRHNQAR